MQPWSRDQIESQLERFPQGQICVEVEGKLAASSSSLVLEYDPNLAWHNWKAIADGGYIRNHNNKGDTLYGISRKTGLTVTELAELNGLGKPYKIKIGLKKTGGSG